MMSSQRKYISFVAQGVSEPGEFHHLPISSEYDPYSRGPDSWTDLLPGHGDGRDDIVRGPDGEFSGAAGDY